MLDDAALKISEYDFDDDLLEKLRQTGQAQARVYVAQELAVVLGRGSKPHLELNLENCLSDQVAIKRRRGGGGAVVLDEGNVIVSLVLPVAGIGDNLRHFRRIAHWLGAALSSIGIPGIYQDGVSDLVLDDRKIGGACIYRQRDLLFYSTTLLVAPRLDLIVRYLAHPPREPEYRRGRHHLEFLGQLPLPIAVADAHVLAKRLSAEIDVGLRDGCK